MATTTVLQMILPNAKQMLHQRRQKSCNYRFIVQRLQQPLLTRTPQQKLHSSVVSSSSPNYSTTSSTFNSYNSNYSGRGSNNNNNNNRRNLDRDVLLPASRGELSISSKAVIPKLLARRKKANLGAASSHFMNSDGDIDDDDYVDPDEDMIDPNDPYQFSHKKKTVSTLSKIASHYRDTVHHHQVFNYQSTTQLPNSRLDTTSEEDAPDPQSYVLINADITMNNSDSDENSIQRKEQEIEIMTQILIETVRHVAELAIIDASEESAASGTVLTQEQKQENELRKNTIMMKLHNIEQRVLNDQILPNDGGKRINQKYLTSNGVPNSSLSYVDTNLIHGIKYDGTPSVDTTNIKFHPNKYLPYNKYYLSNEGDDGQNSTKEKNSILHPYDNDDNLFDEDDDDENKVLDMNNPNPEMELLQQEAILAYAKVLELDMDFYWNEMDYDYLYNTNGNTTDLTSTYGRNPQSDAIKEELAKKEAIAKLLEEARQDSQVDDDDDEQDDLANDVDDIDGGGRGKDKRGGVDTIEPPLTNYTPIQKKKRDFVAWFCKNNNILQYEYDPRLMTPKEIQNLSPMARKRLQDMGVDFNQPEEEVDERDVLYKDHPDMMELCSGSTETILVEDPHVHSKREPKPYFRHNVAFKPDDIYLSKYCRYAYVNNLPPIYMESSHNRSLPAKLIDITNPVDRTYFQRIVANIMNISDIDQIYPASNTSAYIGYTNAIGLATTLMNGPNYNLVQSMIEDKIPTPTLQLLVNVNEYDAKYKDHPFVTKCNTAQPDSDKCIVLLSNLDTSNGRRYTSISLVQDLFKSNTKDKSSSSSSIDIGGMVYGNITADDVFIVNASTAMIKFGSLEQAVSVLDSNTMQSKLRLLNTRVPYHNSNNMRYNKNRIEILRARRELIHRGWDTKRGQFRGTEEIRTLGKRLIVDGDMPTKQFYISHAGVVMLSNVDPTMISKRDLSDFVQPYCSLQRDIEGSIEWVTCNYNEQRTDRVYIGFDLVHEAEQFVKAVGSSTNALYMNIDKHRRPIHIKLVRDRQPPNYPAPALQRRPDRTIEELLSDLQNWEKFVDPEDIVFLEQNHISKHVLDEVFRNVRYNNNTFGALDYAMRNESIEPDKGTGQQYRDFVQLYIKTLKGCIATPENPGQMFNLIQYPNEEPDLSYFDYENRRLERIKKQRDPRLIAAPTATTSSDTATMSN